MESANVFTLQANPVQEKVFESFRTSAESGGQKEQTADLVFDNLVWLNSEEAAQYLRKSVGALRVMVCRGHIRARKFKRRLFFRRTELERQIENSDQKGV